MVAYLEKLQEPNGLFFHAPDVKHFWGRGDGWVAVGMADMLSALPAKHKLRKPILAAYRNMMATLLTHQADTGMWRQIIDNAAELARDLEHRDVHLRHGERREERLAARRTPMARRRARRGSRWSDT